MINYQFISSLKQINNQLRGVRDDQLSIDKSSIKSLIEKHIGQFSTVGETFPYKSVYGVDGSYNTFGDKYPYKLAFLTSGYFGTGNKSDFINKVLYPNDTEVKKKLFEIMSRHGIESREAAFDMLIKKEVAKMEVEVAKRIISEHNPDVILMDGGLLRYSSLCSSEYYDLVSLAIEMNVILVGVIEDIGTFIINKTFKDNKVDSKLDSFQYDKEILYGLLNHKEVLHINDQLKFKDGILTSFARFSKDSSPIGIDILTNHKKEKENILSLIHSITPYNTRGIPVVIDKVDSMIKVQQLEVEQLVKNYIDVDLLELFFVAKRNKR